MVVAQLVLTGLVTHVASLSTRPLVMPAVTVVAMMVIAALLKGSRKSKIAAIVFSTMISVVLRLWVATVGRSVGIHRSRSCVA